MKLGTWHVTEHFPGSRATGARLASDCSAHDWRVMKVTPTLYDASEYHACVDPLHRNVWPVRVGGTSDADRVVGYLTEHITVTLDLPTPPETRWSWKFDDAEANALTIDEDLRVSRGRYNTWRRAFDVFVHLHQLAAALRAGEAQLTAERARKGE